MKIIVKKSFPVSLDEGLTVTTVEPGEHEVPDWVGELAIKHYSAVKAEVKPKTEKKPAPRGKK